MADQLKMIVVRHILMAEWIREVNTMKNIITLKDASGTDVEFKMLDQFTYDKRTYVVLMPHNESTTQVSIFEVVPTKEEGVDGLLGVTPDQTNIIFEVFKERNKDKFNFVEE